MAMEKTVETRSDIQRALDRFTRGEIDFQALLAALDQVFVADPAARRVALDLVDQQRPNGALQRSFFRVLKERIEQQLGSSAPPPRAGGRATADRNRAAPPAASAGARSGATRPFGSRPGSRAERAHPDATRPLDLSPPPEEDERTPHETTVPFTASAPRSERRSPDATRPLTSLEPPPLEMSPAEAHLAFRSPSPDDETAPPESTPSSTPRSSRDELASTAFPSHDATRPLEATQASEPSPARDEPSPSEAKEPASPASESREERFVARRRSGSGVGRGRYANRGWAATGRQEMKEPVSPSPVERSEPAVAQDVEPSAATMPPDFDVGAPIADTRTGATAESGLDTSALDPTPTRPPEEPWVPRRSESHTPAPEDERAATGTMRAAREPAAAEEPAAAPREPVEPVRSSPPPRSPFSRRRQPLPPPRAEEHPLPRGERPFVTERRTIEPPRPQPLARVVGVLVILLLLALVFLGPLKEYVPGLTAFLQRDVPEAFRKVVPAPESGQEVTTSPPAGESPPAAAPEQTSPAGTPGAAAAPPSAPRRADASGKPVPAGATDPRTVTGGTGSPGAATPTGSTNATSARASTSPAAEPGAAGATPPKAATPDTGASTPPKPATTAAAAPSKTVAPGAAAAAPAKAAPAKAAAPAPFPAGRFAFAARSYSGRESGMVPIRIQRRGGSAGTASIAWSTRAESAEPGNDYADFGVRVEEFADGEREKVIYVPITDDDVAEPRESFGVQLENPSDGATLDTVSDVTVTIIDDDH